MRDLSNPWLFCSLEEEPSMPWHLSSGYAMSLSLCGQPQRHRSSHNPERTCGLPWQRPFNRITSACWQQQQKTQCPPAWWESLLNHKCTPQIWYKFETSLTKVYPPLRLHASLPWNPTHCHQPITLLERPHYPELTLRITPLGSSPAPFCVHFEYYLHDRSFYTKIKQARKRFQRNP